MMSFLKKEMFIKGLNEGDGIGDYDFFKQNDF